MHRRVSYAPHNPVHFSGPDTGRSPDYRDLFYRYCESKTALCIGFDFDWAQKGQRVYFLRNGCAGYLANRDRKSTRLNSSHVKISYAVFCLKKKKNKKK